MKIEIAKLQDAPALADLFFSHLAAHPEYISHGEIQMGVGVGTLQGDRFVASPAPDAREKWMAYILAEMSNDAIAHVWKRNTRLGARRMDTRRRRRQSISPTTPRWRCSTSS